MAAALALALGAAVLYAAFADGAVLVPDETRLQVWLAVVAAAALATLLYGRSLRFGARPPATAALGLLAAFALWTALTVDWSISPGETWLEANRAVAYAVFAALAVVVGASLPRAGSRVALGYVAVATAVALYALAGKVGVVDHADELSRLREPLGYWNALAVFCAMAVPAALRAAVSSAPALAAALVPLLATAVLALSRGALVALVAALAIQIALAEDRRSLLAVGGLALLASAPALVLGLTLPALTDDGVPAGDRVPEGLALLAALVLGSAAAAFAARVRMTDVPRPSPALAASALAAGALVLVGGAALSERGSGDVEQPVVPAARPLELPRSEPPETDPARLLTTQTGRRWAWWSEAAAAWADRPISGHGAGSFALLHLRYRDEPVDVREAHSVPLGFLSETGLSGALLALGGLALLGVAAVRGGIGDPYPQALLAGCAAWALHGLVDWDWDIPAVTMPALGFAGVLAASPRRGLSPPSGPLAHGAALALGTTLLALFTVSALLPALARERTDDAYLAALTGADLRKAAEGAEEAARLDPLSAEPLLAGAAVAERRRRYGRSADLLLEAAGREPDDPEVWIRLARLHALYGDARAVSRAARRGLALDPRSELLALILAVGSIDERRSSSATGTPLPERR
jgi:O-Antigen ligase